MTRMVALMLGASLGGAALAIPANAQLTPAGGGQGQGQQALRQAPVALVISNANYAFLPKLPTCEVSANLVVSVLSRAGFKVTRQSNPSNARLGTAIANLGDEAGGPDGRAMVYFCGYVTDFSDRLFLLPVEARLEREADVLSQGIVARLLMSSVAAPSGKAGLVLMDMATPPNAKGRPGFDSMFRPGDGAHAGLAAAAVSANEGQGPAPLAGVLADMLADGHLEVGQELAGFRSNPALNRVLMAVRAPPQASWLLGSAPEPGPATTAVVPDAGPKTASGTAPAASLAELNAADRRRVQLGLQRLGYYRGRINGIFAGDTLVAIRQYQKDSDAEATGKLTARQAEQLLQP